MSVRLTANGIPGFQSDGLVVGRSWSPVEISELAPAARAALVKHTGRFVRVHPEDVGNLAKHGLELYKDAAGLERLREIVTSDLQSRDLAPGEGSIPGGATATRIQEPPIGAGMASEDDVRAAVTAAIAKFSPSDPKRVNKVLGAVKQQLGKRLGDMAAVKAIAESLIAEK